MSEDRVAALEKQVGSLSAELARGRRTVRVLGVVAVAGVLAGGGWWDNTVRTRAVEIIDQDGTVVARLASTGWSERRSAELTLTNGRGSSVHLTADDRGSSLSLGGASGVFGDRGPARAWLNASPEGTSLQLNDDVGTARVHMAVTGPEQVIEVTDASGQVHAALGGGGSGEQNLFLGDRDGGPALGLKATSTGINAFHK